jgi:hypothetical protein
LHGFLRFADAGESILEYILFKQTEHSFLMEEQVKHKTLMLYSHKESQFAHFFVALPKQSFWHEKHSMPICLHIVMGNAKFCKEIECKPEDVRYNPLVHKIPKKEESEQIQIQIELDEEFYYRQKLEEKKKEEEGPGVIVIDLL